MGLRHPSTSSQNARAKWFPSHKLKHTPFSSVNKTRTYTRNYVKPGNFTNLAMKPQ